MTDQELELRRLELAEKEIQLKHEELKLRFAEDKSKSLFATPVGVALAGGILAILSGIFSTLVQGCTNSELERKRQESQLILKAIESDAEAVNNLQFLVNAGLIPDEQGKIKKLIVKFKEDPSLIPAFPAPAREVVRRSPGEFVYYVESLPPDVDETSARRYIKMAWQSWQNVCGITATETQVNANANVIITGRRFGPEAGGARALTDLGGPGGTDQLRLVLNLAQTWDSEMFRSTVGHEIGHVLGIRHRDVPEGSLMSAAATPGVYAPKPADISVAQGLWGPAKGPPELHSLEEDEGSK